ncbi:MAG: Mov34/MPN/PAD-1 family protein, partial [Tumebacillaceae bacterium]
MIEMLELEASVYEALCEWCLKGTPEERCGLLSGSRNGATGRVQRMYPIANVAPEPWHRFRMAPVEQKRAYDRMRASGETWVGLFHS